MAEYFTALGTPIDNGGAFLAGSFKKQVEDQISYDAAGLLVMGSMGLGVFVRDSDYYNVAKTGTQAANAKARVFVGVSDTCIARCIDRINTINDLNFHGAVATVPYYYAASDDEQIRFFTQLATASSKPLYLYDLPAVSKSKISYQTCVELSKNSNIKGIKTADIILAADVDLDIKEGKIKSDFEVFYSGLDNFDSAYKLGISSQLDGMFACTGPITQRLYKSFSQGNIPQGRLHLKEILRLRNLFIKGNVMPSFTCAMNLLGYPGNYHIDVQAAPSAETKSAIKATMEDLNLI